MAIHFKSIDGITLTLSDRRRLKTYLAALFDSNRLRLEELTFIFCSDSYLLNINQQFLKHDTLTDIITFSLNDSNRPIIGEVFISLERVKENAVIFDVPFATELHRVIFHGVLHLCGYKDKQKQDKMEMTAQENLHLDRYFNVPRGT